MNWERIREDFPTVKNFTYLTAASIGPIPKTVYEETQKFYQELLNKGVMVWDYGIKKMEETRNFYAKFIGAKKEEIGFTHSTSEGMNIIAHMIRDDYANANVIANELEFPSSTLPCLNAGLDVTFVKPKEGKILIKDIENSIGRTTIGVVTSHVQYSNGFRQDLKELGELARKKELYHIVNPTQSLGALYFNVKDFGVDFMASDGHKWMLSGFGVGSIFVKKEHLEKFKPPFYSQLGQKNLEIFDNKKIDMSNTARRFELGSPHFQNIIGLNAAIRYISKIGIRNIERRILNLTDYLVDELQKLNLEISSPLEEKHRSGIINFKTNKAKDVVEKLERKKIQVAARGEGVRVSVHFYNNENDIDKLISELKNLK